MYAALVYGRTSEASGTAFASQISQRRFLARARTTGQESVLAAKRNEIARVWSGGFETCSLGHHREFFVLHCERRVASTREEKGTSTYSGSSAVSRSRNSLSKSSGGTRYTGHPSIVSVDTPAAKRLSKYPQYFASRALYCLKSVLFSRMMTFPSSSQKSLSHTSDGDGADVCVFAAFARLGGEAG